MNVNSIAVQLSAIFTLFNYASLTGLLGNAILLLALGALYDTLPVRSRHANRGRQFLIGLFVGLIGVVIMLNPWPLTAGIFFDTRSVLLSVSGLFLGWFPTLVAVLITGSVRIVQGGAGMVTGVTVIVVCAALGLGWRRIRTTRLADHTIWELYGFGMIVHVVMLLTMLTLPGGNALPVLRIITLPVMLIYPVVTVLLGLVLVRQERRLTTTAALRESEERFRAVFEQAALGVSMSRTDTGQFVRVNPAFCAMVGYTQEEMKALTYMDLTYGPDLQEDLDKTRRMLAGEITEFKMEKRYRHREGHLIWVRLNIAPIWDAISEPAFTVAVIEDITQAKEIDQRLRYQAHLLQNVSDAILSTDLDFRINLWNRAAESIYGWSEAEALGKTVKELLKPDYGKVNREEVVARFFQDGVWAGEVIQHDRQGVPIHISSQVTLLTDDAGTPFGSVGVNRNITDRVRIQRQMQQIVESVPEGVILLDSDYRLTLINPVAETQLAVLAEVQLGQRLERLGDHPLSEFLPPRPAESLWREIAHASRIYEMAARPVDHDANHGGWVLVLRDVTEDRERQRYQQAQERLVTVGQMAAGIAHDFNNIMGVIVLYAQMLQRSNNLLPKQTVQLSVIQDQAQHASNLIGQILDFSRRSIMSRSTVDLLPLVKEAAKLLERTLPENIRVKLTYSERAFIVKADPTRIQQALMNLALNARDAMPNGGTLCYALSSLTIGPDETPPVPDMAPGKWVCLAVSDTGAGIEPGNLAHLFEPFFTTKEVGKGTGLGLAQVYGIVKQHDGTIGVETAVGVGTTFFLYLPALTDVPQHPPYFEANLANLSGHETLLLAEDNDALREAVADAMSALGYRVVAVSNGVQALDYLTEQSGQVDLVLSDLIMPEMGGMELVDQVRLAYPWVKMAIMSGYPLDEVAGQLQKAGLLAWITKPFVMSDLAGRVRALLDDPLGEERGLIR